MSTPSNIPGKDPNNRYARLKPGESATMIVVRGFHVIIGNCRPQNGKTAHARLIELAGVSKDDVFYGGSISRDARYGYKTKTNSNTINKTLFEDRGLNAKPDDEEARKEHLNQAKLKIRLKVEREQFYWYQDFPSELLGQNTEG